MDEFWSRRLYFAELFCEHLLISSISLFFIIIFGLLIGIFVFYSKKARVFILPLVNFLYTIPSIAMFGLLIPIVGIGLNNALCVLILYGLLPIVRNTFTGLKEVPLSYVEVAKAMGATPRQIFRKVYFPLALPSILSGLRITTVMVIALTSLAALIGAGGLGQAIFRGLNTMNTSLIVIGSLSVSIFAILGDMFVGQFEKNNRLQHLFSKNATSRQKKWIYFNILALLIVVISAIFYINPINKNSKNSIVVATKSTAEQFILGEILAQTIENNSDINVVRKFGIGGGTNNIHPGMVNGNIDIYIEYTGTSTMAVLGKSANESKEFSFEELQKEYLAQFNLRWLGLLGFDNKYSLAIHKNEAENLGIKTFSDLAAQSQKFILGAEFDFYEREDAYQGLIKTYPFNFKKTEEMDINLRYNAMEEGKINLVDAFTTDAQIEAMKLVVLEDDKEYFPEYKAGIVIRQETLNTYPEIESILNKLLNKISTENMRKMNYKVDIQNMQPKDVAKEFLNTI